MGGKSSPPPPPDPITTANAQTGSNIATANANATLNRTNQYTPFGSLVYTPGTPDANGVPQWSANYTLSGPQQQLLDAQTGQSLNLANLATSQLGTVNNMMSTPLSFAGAPSLNNQTVTPGQAINAPNLQTSLNPSGSIQNSINSNLTGWQTGSGGPIQTSLGVTPGQEADATTKAQQANYASQAAYLDPQWQNQQTQLENQLANQGVQQNSEAWNKAMDDFQRQKAFAYNQAQQTSITAGQQGAQALQNLALNAGNFANSAEAQGYSQSANNAAMSNAGLTQAFNQLLAGAEFGNSAQAQGFGQNLQNATFGNQAAQQNYQDLLGSQAQQFGQQSQAASQNFGQSQAARSQFLNELMQQRSNPLNELNALRTGSQVTNPTFGSTPQTNVNPTDVAGIINQNYAQQMQGYNAGVGQQNSFLSGLAGLGGAAMMSPAGTLTGPNGLFSFLGMSDERLKENIHKVGETDDGANLYLYNFKGDDKPQIGVMAQEYEKKDPKAVVTMPSGFKAVDYARVLKNASR